MENTKKLEKSFLIKNVMNNQIQDLMNLQFLKKMKTRQERGNENK